MLNEEQVALKVNFQLCKAHADFMKSKGPVWENRLKLFLLETALSSSEIKKLLPKGPTDQALAKGEVDRALSTLSPLCCRYWERAFEEAKKQRQIFIMNTKREMRDAEARKAGTIPDDDSSLWCPTHFVLVMTLKREDVEEISAQMVQHALTLPKVQKVLFEKLEGVKAYDADNLTRTLDQFRPLCCHVGDEKLAELVETIAPKNIFRFKSGATDSIWIKS